MYACVYEYAGLVCSKHASLNRSSFLPLQDGRSSLFEERKITKGGAITAKVAATNDDDGEATNAPHGRLREGIVQLLLQALPSNLCACRSLSLGPSLSLSLSGLTFMGLGSLCVWHHAAAAHVMLAISNSGPGREMRRGPLCAGDLIASFSVLPSALAVAFGIPKRRRPGDFFYRPPSSCFRH